MSDEQVRSAPTESDLQRLAQCAREPIRTPGSIQPHGFFLGVDPETLHVVAASENCARLLADRRSPLGRSLSDVTGEQFMMELRAALTDPDTANPLTLDHSAGVFDVIVHMSGGIVLVELERQLPLSATQTASAIYAVSHRLAGIADAQRLRSETVRELRAVTGFDRVMIYRFHSDDHGEVAAEDCADDMEPYEGLHFPSSDIPAQARALYVTKLSRAIVGTSAETSAILTLSGEFEPAALDLGDAELRSVSPHHLQFMRNMGQESTVSFSMVTDGVLTGMITCAHRTVRRLPFIQRRGIEVLANQVALQLGALEQVARLRRQVETRHVRAEVITQATTSDDIAGTLVRGAVTVREIIPCDGVAARVNGRTRVVGAAPPTAQFEALYDHLLSGEGGGILCTEALKLDHPALAVRAPSVTGVLMVPVGGAGDFVAFFRDEVLQSVNWLGDQTSANRITPLSPRTSFSAWTDSVAGTAPSWGGLETEAVDLARDLESTLLRKVERELAHLALHDSLTGLPNRRGMLDRIGSLLGESTPPRAVTLLFIDLDGFKEVNDTYGHDVGDALLSTVAERILTETRATDIVARLGGDEFVVVCGETDEADAEHVARRILDAIGKPALLEDAVVNVTASVGIAVADSSIAPGDLIRLADEAMYRAKSSGKNRLSA